jgi:hypothetical protein
VSRIRKLAQDPPLVEGIRCRLSPLQTLRKPAKFKRRAIRLLDDGNHGVAIQNACNIVGDSGGEFALSNRCKVAEQSQSQFPADEGKSIPIQKEEWSAPMKIPKEIEYLG